MDAATAIGQRSLMSDDTIGRTTLPIPDRPYVGLTTYDAKDPNTKYPRSPLVRRTAPERLVVLIDDAGFGASAPSADPIDTPTWSDWPTTGCKYNRFHTTALCSPRGKRC